MDYKEMDELTLWKLAHTVAASYGEFPQVESVALGGSLASGSADQGSDIDLYVYVRQEIPIGERIRIAEARAQYVEVGNQFWEPGDEWIDAETGIQVDVMFRSLAWIEEQLERVLEHHEASVGYSTCFWYNVVSSEVLYDRRGWFEELQEYARQAYPEKLRQAIVAKNHPILRGTASSYRYQLARAVARGDRISINHRVAAILASYFDVLFAVNRELHPGEKRLVENAVATCQKMPMGMREQVEGLIRAVSEGEVIERVDNLAEGLDNLLRLEDLLDERNAGNSVT